MEAAALNFHGRAQVWNAQFYGYWMHRVLDSEGDWFKADVHVQRHLVSSYKVDGAAREHQTMEAAFTSGKSFGFTAVRARPGRLSALSGSNRKSVLYGAFVFAQGA